MAQPRTGAERWRSTPESRRQPRPPAVTTTAKRGDQSSGRTPERPGHTPMHLYIPEPEIRREGERAVTLLLDCERACSGTSAPIVPGCSLHSAKRDSSLDDLNVSRQRSPGCCLDATWSSRREQLRYSQSGSAGDTCTQRFAAVRARSARSIRWSEASTASGLVAMSSRCKKTMGLAMARSYSSTGTFLMHARHLFRKAWSTAALCGGTTRLARETRARGRDGPPWRQLASNAVHSAGGQLPAACSASSSHPWPR